MSLQNTDYDQEPIEQALRQGEGNAYRSSPGPAVVLSESRMREICTSGCVSSEGWHVQQETDLPGQKSGAP